MSEESFLPGMPHAAECLSFGCQGIMFRATSKSLAEVRVNCFEVIDKQ